MNHCSRTFFIRALLFVAAMLFAASTSLASLVGVRISSLNVDNDADEITFDLTVFDTNNPGQVMLGDLLDRTIVTSYTTVLPNNYGLGTVNYRVALGARSDWNTFPHPALNFGDGDTMPTATLPLQGTTSVSGSSVFAYRLGALSHSYGTDGNFMLRATVGPDGGPMPGLGLASTVNVVTGYPLTGNLSNDFSVYRLVYPTSAPSTPVYNYTGVSLFSYPDTLRYITAREDVSITGGPGAGPTVLEVPTLGTWAMMALAALLATSGLMLLRRD